MKVKKKRRRRRRRRSKVDCCCYCSCQLVTKYTLYTSSIIHHFHHDSGFYICCHQRRYYRISPKSSVPGDIFPQLVGVYSDLLAVPLGIIYNLVNTNYVWPEIWKLETVSIIPKGSNPESLSTCRNLFCTTLFSKTLETFVFDRIKAETSLSPSQYGGIKKCRAGHFLVESWEEIVLSLQDPRAAMNLVSIDFE